MEHNELLTAITAILDEEFNVTPRQIARAMTRIAPMISDYGEYCHEGGIELVKENPAEYELRRI